MIKELLQTATAGAVLAIATTAQGGLLVGGYAKGPSLMFDFVSEPMVATVETAFLGLLYMLGGVDDDQCTSFRSRAQPSGAHQGGPLTPKGDAFAPQTCRRSRHPWKHVGQRHLPLHCRTFCLARGDELSQRRLTLRSCGGGGGQAAIITFLAIVTCVLYRCWTRRRRTSTGGGRRADKARGRYATLQQQYVARAI